MEISGNIRKMEAVPGEIIHYSLPVGDTLVDMNRILGQEISLQYEGRINCLKCGRETRKSFAQGYCYPCFITAPETEECVLRPELCRAHVGEARDLDYAKKHCLIEHVVYLALTSGLKVGVTRNTQVPVRWIDQGAIMAIELARTPNRYTAGQIEVSLKSHITDKTNWRKMLSEPDPENANLIKEKERLGKLIPDDLKAFITSSQYIKVLKYPVLKYPVKIKSLNFDTNPVVTGVLAGIKGQYLLFEDNSVINLRKFGGYYIQVKFKD